MKASRVVGNPSKAALTTAAASQPTQTDYTPISAVPTAASVAPGADCIVQTTLYMGGGRSVPTQPVNLNAGGTVTIQSVVMQSGVQIVQSIALQPGQYVLKTSAGVAAPPPGNVLAFQVPANATATGFIVVVNDSAFPPGSSQITVQVPVWEVGYTSKPSNASVIVVQSPH